jgi:hypothetical protein
MSRQASRSRPSGRRGKSSAPKMVVPSPLKPPQIRSNVTVSHVYRFVNTGTNKVYITPEMLLTAAGTVCTVANTTCTSIFGAVKVNRLRVWGSFPGGSTNAPATVSVEWMGDANNIYQSNLEVSDTSNSVTAPAFVDCRPPRNSLAAFWQNTGTTAAFFTLAAEQYSIVDVHLSLILYDDDADTTQATRTVTTGTLGLVYYLGLDSGNQWEAVSLTTTS